MKSARKEVYDKCNGRCAYCGAELNGKFHVDHVVPQEQFKQHISSSVYVPDFLKHLTEYDVEHIDNKLPACGSCNNYKSSMHLELFRSQIGELVTRLNKRFTQYKIAKRFGQVEEKETPIIFYFEKLTK
jgi:5-methylcytosine-specific restriction endonuclease McrA